MWIEVNQGYAQAATAYSQAAPVAGAYDQYPQTQQQAYGDQVGAVAGYGYQQAQVDPAHDQGQVYKSICIGSFFPAFCFFSRSSPVLSSSSRPQRYHFPPSGKPRNWITNWTNPAPNPAPKPAPNPSFLHSSKPFLVPKI
ncbi:hypothetical protein Droror1_Dr00020292 [Drosera rotundifolia]